MRINIHIFMIIAGLAISCNIGNQKKPINGKIIAATNELAFDTLTGYFVRNDYREKELHAEIIGSKTKMDSIFGYAALMGQGMDSCSINFDDNLVVGLIGEVTDNAISFVVSKVTLKDKELMVHYRILNGQLLSYKARHSKVLKLKRPDSPVYKVKLIKDN